VKDVLLFIRKVISTGKNAHLSGEEVFWSKVVVSGTEDCWLWKNKLYRNGYGHFQLRAKDFVASRVAYQLSKDVELDTLQEVCHTCDNPRCCNPKHLFLGSRKVNMEDAVSKGKFYQNAKLGSGRRQLSAQDVETIRSLYATNTMSQKTLALTYKVKPNQISRIVNFKRRILCL
jgi:Zinc-binding loop region of homing endonuclease